MWNSLAKTQVFVASAVKSHPKLVSSDLGKLFVVKVFLNFYQQSDFYSHLSFLEPFGQISIVWILHWLNSKQLKKKKKVDLSIEKVQF